MIYRTNHHPAGLLAEVTHVAVHERLLQLLREKAN
jgi:hypothetical protein